MRSAARARTIPRKQKTELELVRAELQLLKQRCRGFELQLRQSQKMQSLGLLTAVVAHDFNNLLTAIGVHSELGLNEQPPAPVRESLNEIRTAYLSAKEMVRRILDFSRRSEGEQRPITIAPVAKDAVKLLRAAIPATIDVRLRCGPNLPMILAEPGEIHQIIMNLGTNAAYAMAGREGHLMLNMSRVKVSETNPPVPKLAPGDYLRLTVRDNGVGIDRALIEKIFDPFFTTKGDGGTGLGLAVVNGIVLEHRGGISVQSEPGRGTTFCLFFPEARSTIR